jgi:hypothetical protein
MIRSRGTSTSTPSRPIGSFPRGNLEDGRLEKLGWLEVGGRLVIAVEPIRFGSENRARSRRRPDRRERTGGNVARIRGTAATPRSDREGCLTSGLGGVPSRRQQGGLERLHERVVHVPLELKLEDDQVWRLDRPALGVDLVPRRLFWAMGGHPACPLAPPPASRRTRLVLVCVI